MHVRNQHEFTGHCVQESIEAVYNDDAGAVVLDGGPHEPDELARRHFRRVELRDSHEASVSVSPEIGSHLRSSQINSRQRFVEVEDCRYFSTLSGSCYVPGGDSRLAAPGGTYQQSAGAARDTTVPEAIQVGNATRYDAFGRLVTVLSGDKTGKNAYSACPDRVIMKSLSIP
jgi:hypothetical protein